MADNQSHSQTPEAETGPSRLLIVLAILAVVVPFFVWRGTWFGRPLTDQQLEEYLRDDEHPRKIQHALSQVATKIDAGDHGAESFYPRIAALAGHDELAIRTTAAWVMGQDNESALFHQTLLEMLRDRDTMVRRNAALSLVRFSDAQGREELVKMLAPFEIRAAATGTLAISVEPGQTVGPRGLLAQIESATGEKTEVRSEFSAMVTQVYALDGKQVSEGDRLLVLNADADQVWESLRALYFVGLEEDLPVVTRYQRGAADVPNHVREQATLTARAIRTRSAPGPSH